MAEKAQTESITLKLEQQISSAADTATGALGRLESQIMREQNALGRLEKNLTDARSKLEALAAGAPSAKAVQAYERQASAVEALREKMNRLAATGDPKAAGVARQLADAQAKLSGLKPAATSSVTDVAAYRKQQAAIEVLTDRIGSQRDKIGGLKDKVAQAKTFQTQMTSATKMLGTELGVTGSRAAQLGSSLAALGPYGAIAAASILVVVGSLAVVVSMFAKAMSASGKMRAEFLQLQASSVSSTMGFHWLLNATRESSLQADRMTQSINRVSASSSAGRAQLTGYAAQINAARFYGDKAETVLKAMSIAGTAGSEKMAQEVLQMSRAYRFAGRSVDDLAERVEKKLGRTALEKAISLDAQMTRLGENITWIFGGADFQPLLRAMNTVLSLFNAGGKSATSMREMVTKMAEKAIGGILDVGIAALKLYIALRKNETAWTIITTVVKYAVFGLFLFAGAVTAAVVALLILPAAIFAVEAAIIGSLVGGLIKAYKFLSTSNAKFWQAGERLMGGLADGVRAGAVKFWEALKSVVGIGVTNTEAQLEVKSPSRVGMRIGGHFTGGMAGGVRAGAPALVGATSRVTGAMMAESRAMVANDVRAPVFSPHFAASIAAPAMAPGFASPRQHSDNQRPTVVIRDCTFGAGVTQEMVRDGVLEALESSQLSAGRAA